MIPENEKAIVVNTLHKIIKNSSFQYYANPSEKKYYAKFLIRNLTFDENFEILKRNVINVKEKTNDKKIPFPFLPMIFEDGYLFNRNSLYDEETKSKISSMMELQITALKNSNYTLIYNFPYKIKKNSFDNKDFKRQKNKKSLIFESNIYDLQIGNKTSEVKIKLKK